MAYLFDTAVGTAEAIHALHDGRFHSTSLSPDGANIAFESDSMSLGAGRAGGYIKTLATGHIARLGKRYGRDEMANASGPSSWSDNRRYLAFRNDHSTHVEGDTSGVHDMFLRDRELAMTQRVGVRDGGGEAESPAGSSMVAEAPVVSADATRILFVSYSLTSRGR